MLPRLGDDAGGEHGTVLVADAGDPAADIVAEVALTLRESEHQAALAVLIAACLEDGIDRRIGHAVQTEADGRLLRIGDAEHGRIAKLTLHDLTGGCDGRVPVLKHIAEAEAVLRHVLKNT